MILPCTCTSEYQDRRYGPGNRVYNKCGREGAKKRYRCTVCRKMKDAPRVRTG